MDLEAEVVSGNHTFAESELREREESRRRFSEWKKHEAYFERRREEYLVAPTEKEKNRILDIIRNDPFVKAGKAAYEKEQALKAQRRREAAEAAAAAEQEEA